MSPQRLPYLFSNAEYGIKHFQGVLKHHGTAGNSSTAGHFFNQFFGINGVSDGLPEFFMPQNRVIAHVK
ncbi:hypothetical protein SAMN02745218_00163 [Desulfofundulus australicus DSM 11792]|uniref:Uncharacterized protein n=1 Tax=Desulfofundulus australicus DSM 11792 TaxID=1121425 RepID=A0A1M4SM21_9FIRM|nr:hypothetical protein SAMN02745218_00163 [Desulfofundulus australicus DSM 11792]